mmetsp:Transcript_5892/g.12788  ORF Transcript_5892/g.12788 Transcript_5892/m.12788 type:complete len:209 (-) Transcript_5892:382-1008(-)
MVSIILLLATTAVSSGFVPSSRSYVHRCPNTNIQNDASLVTSTALSATSRRNFLTTTSTIATATATILSTTTTPAYAKEAPPPITRELVTSTFDAIRLDLTSPDGVYSTLTNLINDGKFEDVMQYTKESDAYFRRGKIGKARKLLTDKDLKGEAIQMSNAVTFDLIGINRASRPGKENKEEQLRYLGVLKTDVERILELEATIQVVDE